MIADAGHSLGDLASDIVTLTAVRFARRPTNTNHPYGFGRYEVIMSIYELLLIISSSFYPLFSLWFVLPHKRSLLELWQ